MSKGRVGGWHPKRDAPPLTEPDLRISLIRLFTAAHKEDSTALFAMKPNYVAISDAALRLRNVSLNFYTAAHAAILFAPQTLPCFVTTMSMSDCLYAVRIASLFQLVDPLPMPCCSWRRFRQDTPPVPTRVV